MCPARYRAPTQPIRPRPNAGSTRKISPRVRKISSEKSRRRCARSWPPSSGVGLSARSTVKARAGTREPRSSRSVRARSPQLRVWPRRMPAEAIFLADEASAGRRASTLELGPGWRRGSGGETPDRYTRLESTSRWSLVCPPPLARRLLARTQLPRQSKRRIIQQMIAQLKGESRFDWCAEGLVCEITLRV
jgi:hypothetical protein